jgi:hypothetical protein
MRATVCCALLLPFLPLAASAQTPEPTATPPGIESLHEGRRAADRVFIERWAGGSFFASAACGPLGCLGVTDIARSQPKDPLVPPSVADPYAYRQGYDERLRKRRARVAWWGGVAGSAVWVTVLVLLASAGQGASG